MTRLRLFILVIVALFAIALALFVGASTTHAQTVDTAPLRASLRTAQAYCDNVVHTQRTHKGVHVVACVVNKNMGWSNFTKATVEIFMVTSANRDRHFYFVDMARGVPENDKWTILSVYLMEG